MSAALRTELKVGFMPLLDCALLVVAHEVGMARSEGLSLRLLRESSWANIRDRVAIGHFDAAHMLGPMVVAENVGVGHLDTPLVAPVALGTGGNAITVSRPLWDAMSIAGASIGAPPAQQAQALAKVVADRAAAGQSQLTLAMVFPFSCHNYQLRDWLESGGIDPDRAVRLVVLPPPLLVDALRSGQVDGFCVGEPWNSLAVDAGIGVIAAVGSEVWPNPPEKVLGMRARYAEQDPGLVAALVRAIHGASVWAADPGNHVDLAQLLSQPRYVGAPARLLLAALGGVIRCELRTEPPVWPQFLILGPEAIVPHERYADLFYSRMCRWGQVAADDTGLARARAGFRIAAFEAALREGPKLP
jgi:NitT/TauT family transport system ATP-binding protein